MGLALSHLLHRRAFSHILLDWTNNYGVRPFFPFNPRWYAGSFVFIAEPVLWALFLLALVMPWLFGLTDREIGARRARFRGRGWAIFALAGMRLCGYGDGWSTARRRPCSITRSGFGAGDENGRRTLPDQPLSLARHPGDTRLLPDCGSEYVHGSIDSDPQTDVLFKPDDTPAVEAAKRTFLGSVYLDWGTWAVIRDMGQQPIEGVAPPQLPPGRNWTTVEFSDLRFAYAFTRTGRARPPSGLSGWVYIIDNRDDGGEAMGGREQK